jgi:hypothetical protein
LVGRSWAGTPYLPTPKNPKSLFACTQKEPKAKKTVLWTRALARLIAAHALECQRGWHLHRDSLSTCYVCGYDRAHTNHTHTTPATTRPHHFLVPASSLPVSGALLPARLSTQPPFQAFRGRFGSCSGGVQVQDGVVRGQPTVICFTKVPPMGFVAKPAGNPSGPVGPHPPC